MILESKYGFLRWIQLPFGLQLPNQGVKLLPKNLGVLRQKRYWNVSEWW
jgi:hypothetical protein